MTGPDVEVLITLVWWACRIVGALLIAWLAMLALDFLVLPFLPGRAWKRPWCWLLGHIEGEDFEITADGFFDKCIRCGRLTPTDDD